MKILAIICFMIPLVLTAQKVGINTTDPQHPFQVNVDSIWTDTIEDQVLGPHVSILGGLVIIPGVEKGAQRFTVGTAGYFSQLKIYFGFPTNADEVLVEVFRGSEPEEEFMTSGALLNVAPGARTIIFPQNVTLSNSTGDPVGGIRVHSATNSIVSSVDYRADLGTEVQYTAGNFIDMKPGFQFGGYGISRAMIGPCPNDYLPSGFQVSPVSNFDFEAWLRTTIEK